MVWHLLGSDSDLDSDVSGKLIRENARINVFIILDVFQTKVPFENINQENLEMKTAFLGWTCGRFRRPGFLGARACTKY